MFSLGFGYFNLSSADLLARRRGRIYQIIKSGLTRAVHFSSSFACYVFDFSCWL